jgi:archaeal type IV pilus assembly protein PilA
MRKMSVKRMFKSKKAISPILATLLLIVIAVAAIVVTYAWITTYMGNTTQQAGVMLYKENIRFNGTATPTTVITVGNSGTGDTRLTRVYLGNSAGNMTDVTSKTSVGSGVSLNAGTTATVTITWDSSFFGNWTAGTTYYFRIVPNPGQFLEIQEKAPQ